jgi:hypothetical protein
MYIFSTSICLERSGKIAADTNINKELRNGMLPKNDQQSPPPPPPALPTLLALLPLAPKFHIALSP